MLRLPCTCAPVFPPGLRLPVSGMLQLASPSSGPLPCLLASASERTIEEILIRIIVLTRIFPHFHVKLREMGTIRMTRAVIAALIDVYGLLTYVITLLAVCCPVPCGLPSGS